MDSRRGSPVTIGSARASSPRMKSLFALFLVAVAGGSAAFAYDPLDAPGEGSSLEQTVHDTARKRDLPLRIYLPAATSPAPVVLFSHGLGGSRNGSAFLGKHWAARGYVAVFLQHPGSDDGTWRDVPPAERMKSLRAAASPQNFFLRVKDVSAVIDQLTKWQNETGHPLAGRLDLERIGMSGHSFGAVTTQAVSGQSAAGSPRFTDRRIKAAISMSPSPPAMAKVEDAFGSVTIPWMLMTGTKDQAFVADFTPEQRMKIFPALPAGGKYELILDKAEHSAFTETALPGDSEPRNPNHHRAILALSTAFWDAYLKDDPQAKAWLEGAEARSVLEAGDRWQWK